jgi:tetratricopeptide (TPR) repeat protein
MLKRKLAYAVIALALLTMGISTASASPPAKATFQVPITYIRAYTALYPEFFEKVVPESEGDRGITYLDEIEKRKYILTAEEARNMTINYTMYVYDKTPDTEYEWLALAIYYMGDYRYVAQYGEAEKAVKEALRVNPESFEAYSLLFYLYDRNRVEGNSSLVLRKLEELAKSSEHYGLLGRIYAGDKTNPFNNHAKSKYYYEKALEKDPGYAPAYAGLAAYYHYQVKDYSKAKKYLETFLKLRPGDSWALSILEEYSSTYVPMGKKDPLTLVMAGIATLFALYVALVFLRKRKA